MDTPIYAELRETLIDPEDTDWGQSSPPEFAAALTERAGTGKPESPTPTRPSATTTGKRSRARARSHRKED